MKNKRFWWLKLREDFFKQKEMKKLRRMAGGDTFTVIYLKMQLLSLKKNGIILFERIENNLADELALELDEDSENVQMTLLFLQNHGLIEEITDDEYLLPRAAENIGTESSSAERMRKHRERKVSNQKSFPSQCGADVTSSDKKVTTDIDLVEEDKDIRIPPYIPPRGTGDEIDAESFSQTVAFEKFWEAYPKKNAYTAAEKEWLNLSPTLDLICDILGAINEQKKSKQWRKENGQYIPEAANWLKDRRWKDKLEPDTGATNPTHTSYDLEEIENLLNSGRL